MSRRGRTRKSGRRTACGKLVQAKAEERADKVRAVPLEARQRVHGLTPNQAASEHAGTVLGRLWLARAISEAQRDAGYRYTAIVAAFHKAIWLRKLTAAGDLDRGGGHDGDADPTPDEVAAFKRARERHRQCRTGMLTCGVPLAAMTVETVVIQDMELSERFYPDLRAGLDALAKVLRIERREAA